MPRIVDCSMFFEEIELLELRLTLLRDVVDHFIVCEADMTHSGNRREPILSAHAERLKAICDRLTVITYHFPDSDRHGKDAAFCREAIQRDAMIFEYAKYLDGKTWVWISDADEIPDPDSADALIADGVVYGMQRCLIYSLDYEAGQLWPGTTSLPPSARVTPSLARTCRHGPSVIGGKLSDGACGWHMTYFGGVRRIQSKLSAFCERDVGVYPYTDTRHIETRMARMRHPTEERAIQHAKMDYPDAIMAWAAKYPQMLEQGNGRR